MKPLALFLVYLSTRITVLMMLVLRYIYLPGSNSSHVQYSFASVSIKKKEGGSDFSNKAGFLQTCSSFVLFFLLKLLLVLWQSPQFPGMGDRTKL